MAGEGITDISNLTSGAGGSSSFNAEGLAEFLVKDEGDKFDKDGSVNENGTFDKDGNLIVEELTANQISEQLTDIKAKDQTTLSDEDKTFLEKHDEKEVSIEDLKNKPEDQRTDEEKKTLKVHAEKEAIKVIEAKDEANRTDEEKKILSDYEEANKPPSIIEQVVDRVGTIEGEFTDDVDGIVSLIEKVADKAGNNKANEMLTKFPEVAQLLQHRVKGGSLDTFMKSVRVPDFSKVELSKDNVENSKEMYTTYLKSTGLPLKDVLTLVQNAEDEGDDALLAKAQAGQTVMVNAHNAQVAVQVDRETVLADEEKVRVTNYWNEVNGVLKSGSIEGINIPKDDIKNFESFLKDKDENQAARVDYEYAKLSVGQRMFLDYLVYKNFDVKGLNLQRKSTGKSLSQVLGQGSSENKLGSAAGAKDKEGDTFDISKLEFDPSKMHVVQ